jgi:ATP/maltotriose-dependent transcriptional regulator MalT
MTPMADTVEQGRDAFARRAWGEAYALLGAGEPLAADDLERLAVAAYLLGRDDESAGALERAHLEHIQRAELNAAACCALWLAMSLMLRGEMARASGWHARAERLAEQVGQDCPATGFVLMPGFLQALMAGDPATAKTLGERMTDIGVRFADPDLVAMGLLALGQALLALGETKRGMKSLDEAMVAVTTGEVSPIPAGIIYCAVIEACMDVFDLRRAAEWTEALQRWCASQPDLVPYRGQCLVHRAQVLQAHGEWADALDEADRANRWLAEPVHPARGLALYQQGELRRLRGEFAEAEQAYREASRFGREPAPGFALLRLAEGNVDAAVAATKRMVEESRGRFDRPAVLAAAVEVLLAVGDRRAARSMSDDLAAATARLDAPMVQAIADFAAGTVLLAEGDATAALAALRRAAAAWYELGMPYEVARARAHIGIACTALGDHDAAAFELDAARSTFERLGAGPDLQRLAAMLHDGAEPPRHRTPLTERECEVLRQVAAGKTNREIATALSISEHTVGRHLQNIFTKLGISSRAAATAYAFEHHLM